MNHLKLPLSAWTGVFCLLLLSGLSTAAHSQTEAQRQAVKCDAVFDNVYASVAATPQKVLAIVEQQIRASELCACEIVKAAIHSSKANADLINQIKLTAIAAAPAQEEIIKACVAALTNRDADDDYQVIPPDIRGVYLIQPAAAGVRIVRQEDDDDRRRPNPPRRPRPQSPSTATP